jgi:predicted enzyme related to lactoylglutathione lyase
MPVMPGVLLDHGRVDLGYRDTQDPTEPGALGIGPVSHHAQERERRRRHGRIASWTPSGPAHLPSSVARCHSIIDSSIDRSSKPVGSSIRATAGPAHSLPKLLQARTFFRIAGLVASLPFVPASVGFVVIDSIDPAQLATFWCALLEVEVDMILADGQFIVLTATSGGVVVGFQRVPEAKTQKNRVHLDLMVDDLDESTVQIESLGGSWTENCQTRELDGFRWRCMADPEGNEFDIDVLPA